MTAVAREDDVFTDAEGVRNTFYRWSVADPRAIVQIVHGLGDHALRYERFALDLNRAGYSVYAHDQRGHGATGLAQYGGDHSRLGALGPGGLRATIAALRQFTVLIEDENPGVPIFLVAQSWGSLMVQRMINDDVDAYSGAVLTGTAYRLPGGMNAGDLAKPHRPRTGGTGYEWLTRDPAAQAAAAADPLMFYPNVLKLFGIPDGVRLFGRPSRNAPKDLPVLLTVGDRDSLGGRRSVERLAAEYRKRSGFTDVEVAVYPGARHELLNETNRDEVIADMIAWLDGHTARGTTPDPSKE